MNVQENAPVITLSGDVDIDAAATLAVLEKELCGRASIVLDVAGLRHFDSTFLRFLVRLQNHAAARTAPLELVGVQPRLRRVLEITGLARMLSL